ncbi:Lectin precursor, partial [Aphelenchoides avenae]
MSRLLSTVAFLVGFATQVSATCPAGAVQGLSADQCYIFGKVPSTWLQSEEECSAFNGHLASIASYLTNSFVVTTAVPCLGDYWLGGNKGLYSQDAWSWNDGQRFGFSNWAT